MKLTTYDVKVSSYEKLLLNDVSMTFYDMTVMQMSEY